MEVTSTTSPTSPIHHCNFQTKKKIHHGQGDIDHISDITDSARFPSDVQLNFQTQSLLTMWVRWARNKKRLDLEAKYKKMQNDARFRHMHYVFGHKRNSVGSKHPTNSAAVVGGGGSGGGNAAGNGHNGYRTPPVTPRGAREKENRERDRKQRRRSSREGRRRRSRDSDRPEQDDANERTGNSPKEKGHKERVQEVIDQIEAKERESPGNSPEKRNSSFLDEVRKQKKYVAVGNRRTYLILLLSVDLTESIVAIPKLQQFLRKYELVW